MVRPIALAALLMASGTALPALAATDPSAPVEAAQYRPTQHQNTNHRRPNARRDRYNAQASARSATPVTRPEGNMPNGWRCVQRRGDDPSAFPTWEFC